MVEFFENMYAFWSFIIAVITAQLAKPLYLVLLKKKIDFSLAIESGGFPSSHTAGAFALCFSIGYREGFTGTLFAISLALAVIISYDAANVRYYAGRNIELTQQLIKDVQDLTQTKLSDPIYASKIKNVLGHKWIEVVGGLVHGILIASILYYLSTIRL